MEVFKIENFKFGLDARRSELTSQPGTLETLENAHINSGGEIEKRKAFVLDQDLGILDDDNGLSIPLIGAHGGYWPFEVSVADGGGNFHYADVTGNGLSLLNLANAYPQTTGIIGFGVGQGTAASSLTNDTSLSPAPLLYTGGGITVSFWLKMTSLPGAFGIGPAVMLQYGANQYGFRFQNNGSGVLVNQIIDMISSAPYAFGPLTNGLWYHIAFTITNALAFVVYLNGVSAATGTYSTVIASSGQYFFRIHLDFNGAVYTVDEVGLWVGQVLNQAAITALYNNGNGRTFPF